MKIYSIELDANGRSTHDYVGVPMTKVSETEAISAKQPGSYWYYMDRFITRNLPRTDTNYDAPGGPFEQHLGGEPHFVLTQVGYMETTLQDGSTVRYAPGDLHFTRAMAPHHSHFFSSVPPQMVVIYVPMGATDISRLKVVP